MDAENRIVLRAGTVIIRIATARDLLIGPHRLMLVRDPREGLTWILQNGEHDPAPEAIGGLDAIRHYVAMRLAKPFLGLGDSVHSIHRGTEFEAELRFTDLVRALEEIDGR